MMTRIPYKPRIAGCLAVSLVLILLSPAVLGQATTTTVGEAQTIARLYSASLDRPPLTAGLNFFINSVEIGRTVISIAEDFVLSAEFVAKYGELDDTAYVERLFLNVLGRPGAQGGIEFWVANLADGNSRAFVLTRFADSPENIANTAILYDSMAFADGQWQYSRVDNFIQNTCGNSGCLQTELNGAVAGANILITPLRDSGTVSATATTATTTSLDRNRLRSMLGASTFNDLSDQDHLRLLGTFPPLQVPPEGLYLITVSGGTDFDNDQDQQVDTRPTTVAGQTHAIVTAEQLSEGMQISVMTEAAYQRVRRDVPTSTDEQVLEALDEVASKLVKNINGDDRVNYRDVRRWRRLYDNDNIRTDLVEVDKLAVAVSTDMDAETLEILSNRMLGGAAAVGLDETRAVAISPEGTCERRGRTIISRRAESIVTSPPTSACGNNDTGRVDSSQGDIVGTITPGSDGLPSNLQVNGNRIDFSDVNPNTSEVTIDLTDRSGNQKRGKVPLRSTDAANTLSSSFRSLPDTSADPDAFDETLTETMSYGALVSSFAACEVLRFIDQIEARRGSIDPEVRSWALAGCTSALPEVNTWVSEQTANQIVAFERAVPEVQLDGCSDCYSYIANNLDAANFEVGERIAFNGVAPPTSTGVLWDFGDGDSSESRTPFHTYEDPGAYLAEFSVNYSDGSVGVNQLTVNVGMAPSPGTFDFEGYFAYTQSSGNCTASGRVRYFITPGEGLYERYFSGSEFLGNPMTCENIDVIASLSPESPMADTVTLGPEPISQSGTVSAEEIANIELPEGGSINISFVGADTAIIVASFQGFTVTLEYNRISPIPGG